MGNSFVVPSFSFSKYKKEELKKREPEKSFLRESFQVLEERRKSLEEAVFSIERRFGKGSVVHLSMSEDVALSTYSTGSLALDKATGIQGFPRGRMIEIFGAESSGKTTIALSAIAQAQKQGALCAYIDAEHALDVRYAKRLGVSVEDLLISQPDYGEQALDIVETLTRSGAVQVIVVDSVAALVPRSEVDGGMGDHHLGLHARLLSQACRKLSSVAKQTNTLLIFINQVRSKIGVIFGSPETTTGGIALKFFASMRLEVRKIGLVREEGKLLGTQVRVNVVKNKLAPPFQEAETEILFDRGFHRLGEIFDEAVRLSEISRFGSFFFFNHERLGRTRQESCSSLSKNAELQAMLVLALFSRSVTDGNI